MNLENLVERYFAAWNQQDADSLLALLHEGVAYHDAFWRESCAGCDLAQYFRDSFVEENYWFHQQGDVIEIESGAIISYTAHERTDAGAGRALFNGAEVLTFRDDKILTVSDHYCDPRPAFLKEVAKLAVRRHGEPKYARSGLGANRFSRIEHELFELRSRGKLSRSPMLTATQLANRIGCPVDHLLQVMKINSDSEFHNYLDDHTAG